jgi:hypothetical protein
LRAGHGQLHGPRRQHGRVTMSPSIACTTRSSSGAAHWSVVEEAHTTLGEGGIAAHAFRPMDLGYCLVTYRPEQLCAEALAAIDVTITVTGPPAPQAGTAPAPLNAPLRELRSPERPFTIAARRTPHVRHRRKYAVAPLPRDRRSFFATHMERYPARPPISRSSAACCATWTRASSLTTSSAATSRAGSPARSSTGMLRAGA